MNLVSCVIKNIVKFYKLKAVIKSSYQKQLVKAKTY